jgi:hypothetical protein
LEGDPTLWASLWVSNWHIWIQCKLQIDQFRIVRFRPIKLFHLLHLGKKRNRGFLLTEGGETAEFLENLLMAVFQIDLVQQKCDQKYFILGGQSKIMIIIYFRLFLELDLVFKSNQNLESNFN